MNIVLDEAVEEKAGGEKVRLGMVVRINEVFTLHDILTRFRSFVGILLSCSKYIFPSVATR